MSDARMTSTGHAGSAAPWLDAHFESARAEYEEALRFVGIGRAQRCSMRAVARVATFR
jgi:hypothetical protein